MTYCSSVVIFQTKMADVEKKEKEDELLKRLGRGAENHLECALAAFVSVLMLMSRLAEKVLLASTKYIGDEVFQRELHADQVDRVRCP